ncbi:MAG: carboxypeptidase-like regulatory domain-containing protein, partial [Paludibacter sp.]
MRKLTFLWACLFLIGVGLVNAQSKSVSGKVLSVEDGQPVIGASVMVKGTTTGTITGMDGEFTVAVAGSAKTLVISYVGMKTIEVDAKSGMLVKMESDAKAIDEVVVTAFGIKRSPREMGVATAKVSDQELTNAGASNVMNGLTG